MLVITEINSKKGISNHRNMEKQPVLIKEVKEA